MTQNNTDTKYYAVICNGQVGRYQTCSSSSGSRDIISNLGYLDNERNCMRLEIVDPATLKKLDDAEMLLFPESGTVIEVVPWDHFIDMQKKKQRAMVARQPNVIPVQAPIIHK